MSLQPGRQLASYRLVEKIGEGGMGVVWKAVDTRLDREVALKVLPDAGEQGSARLRRFEREAKAVAALNHPNIVTLYSIEEAEGVRFITMELVRGKTLDELIPGQGMTLGRFFELAVPLADAVASAHESGVIHRDLKPSNVMLGDDGRLRILDFGLAKLREEQDGALESSQLPTHTAVPVTREGQIMGSVPYMSPEQLHGRPGDPRSDVFAMGVILYEMATGSRPFGGTSSADVISSILRDAPAPVTELNETLPRHLARIVRHCLEKDPDRRCQTAKELRNELEDLRTEVATGELPQPIVARPRRKRGLVALAAAAGLAVVALTVWLLSRPPAEAAAPQALAVMPFANLTGDSERDYLGAGISAGLITRLSEISGVQVVGRAAAWQERDAELSSAERAQRIGAGSLLEGELQPEGERLRIDVKLTDAASGLVLWSQSFRGEDHELVEVQNELSRQLATVLSIRLSPREMRRLARSPTQSFEAYEYFLKAYQKLDDAKQDGSVDPSLAMFRQALRLDPEFALAHSGLSEALWLAWLGDRSADKLAEAERAARRALEIDPDLPAAQLALARVYRSTGRYSESIDELQELLARHPKPDEAQRELAFSYVQVGDLEQAEDCFEAAAALGEGSWFNWNALGAFRERLGRYEAARTAFEQASRVAPPGVGVPHQNLAAITILEGRFDEAIAAYELIPRPISDASLASNIGTAYYFSSRADKWEQAEQYYKLAVQLDPRSATVRRNLGDLYLELERRDDAVHHYREALLLVEQRLQDEPLSHMLRLDRALYAAKAGACETGVPLALELEAELPETAHNTHQLAAVFALCDREQDALRTLATAIRLGFSTEIIRQESELASLHGHPEFQALLDGS